MEREELLMIAQRYARQNNKDTVRRAGERDGYAYFHVFSQETCGHKLGLQQFIRISNKGDITNILPIQEIMWAMKQEIELNKL